MIDIKFISKIEASQPHYSTMINLTNIDLYSDGNNKLAFLKIVNLYNQAITGLSFNLIQYDKNNALISKQVIELKDLLIKRNSTLSYEEPFLLNALTDHLELVVNKINYVSLTFEDGTLFDPNDVLVTKKKNKNNKPKELGPVTPYKNKVNIKLAYSLLLILCIMVLLIAIFFGIFNYDGRYYDYYGSSSSVIEIFTILKGGF